MKDLGKRCLVACFLIPLILLSLLFAYKGLIPFIVAFVFVLGSCIAVYEYGLLAQEKGVKIYFSWLYFFTALVVVSFFLTAKFPIGFLPSVFCLVFAFLSLFLLQMQDKDGAIINLAVNSFALMYIAIPIAMILYCLYFPGSQDGRLWVGYLFLVTKIADVGAYFAGNLLGRKKLAPSISPGKTVEGGIFGLISSVVASVSMVYLIQFYNISGFDLSFEGSLFLGFILGLVGPLGDLAESLLKRDANKKDSNVLPGFGGVLDIVDSLLFTSPVLYLYLNYVHA